MNTRKVAIGVAVALALGGGAVGVDQVQSPYIDTGMAYRLDVQSDIEQGERVEIAKDESRVDLIGWNDEYRVSIRPQFHNTPPQVRQSVTASRSLFSKRMEYSKGDMTAFVEPKDQNPAEFDIDFILDAKPESNIFTYIIEGADDLDFFYQPALTQEEIDQGSERPENVVGSYAVYSKTKRDHIKGQTNYATGKVFHIYRPKAIDADGRDVWAELSYADGILSVTVPQDFLDTAAYPVVVDPTFGYTSIGASNLGILSFNQMRCSTAGVAPEDGTVDSISVYTLNLAANMKGVFVASSTLNIVANGIGNAVAVSTGAGGGWNTSLMSTPPTMTNGTTYVNCFITDADTSANYRGDTVAGYMRLIDSTNSYATPQDPTSPSTNTGTSGRLSIYATYTASAGGGSTPVSDDVIIFE